MDTGLGFKQYVAKTLLHLAVQSEGFIIWFVLLGADVLQTHQHLQHPQHFFDSESNESLEFIDFIDLVIKVVGVSGLSHRGEFS